MINKTKHIGLALLTLMVLCVGCTSVPNNVSIKTADVKLKAVEGTQRIEGVLVPNKSVDVSSRINGQVLKSPYEVGSSVKAGAVVLTLDGKVLAEQVKQAEAGIEAAHASREVVDGQVSIERLNVESARRNYDKMKALYDSEAVAQTQLDDAKEKLDLANEKLQNATGPSVNQTKASLHKAQADVATYKVQLEYTTVKSPISGIVAVKNTNDGETVTAGATVMTIADLSVLKLKSTVSQDGLKHIKVGDTLTVKVDVFSEKEYQGKVTSLGPMAVSTGEVFPIEISIPNDGKLMGGMTAYAQLTNEPVEELTVPIEAVFEANGHSYVFVIENNKAFKKEIDISKKNLQWAWVRKGIIQGNKVAVSGITTLKDNGPIKTN